MNKLRYLALGDSYTIGEQIEFDQNLPHQILEYLVQKKHCTHSLKVVAKTGWTTSNLITAIEEDEFLEEYDLITLLIGVNNQYQQLAMDDFEQDLKTLCHWVSKKVNNNKNIILWTIPDWGQTPFGAQSKIHTDSQKISNEIKNYNRIIQKTATHFGFKCIDIFELSQQQALFQKNDDFPYLTEDLLHYQPIAYQEWAAKIKY